MQNIDIRFLEFGDIPTLAQMDAEIFSVPWSEGNFKDLLTNPYCLYLTAKADGALIGFAGLVQLGNEGDIDRVMVREEYRGKGIAHTLMQNLLAEGQRRGITEFTLEVRAGNSPAIRLYERLGFRSEGIRPKFYEKPVEDAVIMWLR